MIYVLDADPKKAAQFLLPEHLMEHARELAATQLAAAHNIVDEYRAYVMERRITHPRGSYDSEEQMKRLEAAIPAPPRPESLISKWMIATADNWQWSITFQTWLHFEACGQFGQTPEIVDIHRKIIWLKNSKLGPALYGQVYQRTNTVLFPVCVPELPPEYQGWRPHDPVMTYRRHYYETYKLKAKWTYTRKPWWWRAWDNREPPSLSCGGRRR